MPYRAFLLLCVCVCVCCELRERVNEWVSDLLSAYHVSLAHCYLFGMLSLWWCPHDHRPYVLYAYELGVRLLCVCVCICECVCAATCFFFRGSHSTARHRFTIVAKHWYVLVLKHIYTLALETISTVSRALSIHLCCALYYIYIYISEYIWMSVCRYYSWLELVCNRKPFFATRMKLNVYVHDVGSCVKHIFCSLSWHSFGMCESVCVCERVSTVCCVCCRE